MSLIRPDIDDMVAQGFQVQVGSKDYVSSENPLNMLLPQAELLERISFL